MRSLHVGALFLLMSPLGACGPVVGWLDEDLTAPVVISTTPVDDATGVALNAPISATFSEFMDPATITDAVFSLDDGSTVPGTVFYAGLTAVFAPADPLNPETRYTATVGTDATDLAGNPLDEDYVWTFTTRAGLDATPPRVVLTSPIDQQSNVPVGAILVVAFNEAMDASSLDQSTIELKGPGTTVITGSVGYDPILHIATFDPSSDLSLGTTYSATVTTGATDLAGNALVQDYNWTFETRPVPTGDAPFVVITHPEDQATGVSVNTAITAAFSEPMTTTTLNASTFVVTGPGPVTLTGTRGFDPMGLIVTFTPDAPLERGVAYEVTITTGAEDLGGTGLVQDYVWAFETIAPPVLLAPFVVYTNPNDQDVNVPVTATIDAAFSEAMDVNTLNASTFVVTGPGPVTLTGTLDFDPLSLVASFTPDAPLEPGSTYEATITTGAEDLGGMGLVQDYVWTFETRAAPNAIAPFVVFTIPADQDTNVSVDTTIDAVFSEAMNVTTLNASTFVVTGPGPVTLNGTFGFDPMGLIATFTPDAPLDPGAVYEATITTGAEDLDNNGLVQDYVWTFETAAEPNPIAPFVVFTIPGDQDTNVPVDTTIDVVFSERMDLSTLNASTFVVTGPGPVTLTGTFGFDVLGMTATFTPNAPLAADAEYQATITTGAEDLGGTGLVQAYVWTFETAAEPAPIAPFVVFTIPGDQDTNVSVDTTIDVVFSERMDLSTLNASTFVVTGPGPVTLTGTFGFDLLGLTATFTPNAPLQADAEYQATITTGAEDLGGTGLVQAYVWTFETAAEPAPIAPFVVFTIPADQDTNVSVDTTIDVVFSEPMDLTTLNASTFVVMGPSPVALTGTFDFDVLGMTATFTPNAPLQADTEYSATITTGAEDLGGTGLVQAYVWTFETAAEPLVIAPFVVITNPDDEAIGVLVETTIDAAFSEPMDALTLDATTFIVTGPGPVTLTGDIEYNPLTLIVSFTPDQLLELDTEYTATITTGAEDLGGTGLVQDYTWTFRTAPELGAPFVVLTNPMDEAILVPVDTTIDAAFSEAMDSATLDASSFYVTGPDLIPLLGIMEYDLLTRIVSFTPDMPLALDTEYEATITTDAQDLDNNGLVADYVWTFRTVPEIGSPFVVLTNPEDGALGVFPDTTIDAAFSEAMDADTLDSLSFVVTGPDMIPLMGSMEYDALTLIVSFTPDMPLELDTEYEATITTDAQDTDGNGLVEDYVWTFKTILLPAINLDGLENFVAIAGAGLTNSNSSGITTLNGDVGLYPTATCMGDGVPCTLLNPVINGTMYANDPEGIAAQAKVDLTAAYVDGMSRPPGTTVNDISGMVLTPGVYTSASTMSIAVGGTVVLDGQGDQNAVFIFQIGSSLTVNNNAQVLLINGARAKNVFWTIFASSTIGSNVAFQGSVLAGASNSVGTDSVVVGRLLCTTGMITLLSNNITLPPL